MQYLVFKTDNLDKSVLNPTSPICNYDDESECFKN